MTPEIAQQDRPQRQVLINAKPDVLYDQGGDMLVQGQNARGSIEVLASADRSEAFRASIESGCDLLLSGFFRRRSGIKSNGSRGYIWTLVLVSWDECEELRTAA
jgi:hypothetical protein